jgi:quercetin dioxygenase-like cupin family protein
MTTPVYYFLPNLENELTEIPADSILSRTFLANDQLKAILFAFSPGQELSEHTASVPAIVHILSGEARLTLGSDGFDVGAGAWAHMPARLPHSILAKTPVKMLLLMLKA